MEINDEMLMDLAEQLGLGRTVSKTATKTDNVADLAQKYKGKSDQELIDEIMKVKNSMKKDRNQFEKQMKTIKALRNVMNGEQKARLEKLIRLLEED